MFRFFKRDKETLQRSKRKSARPLLKRLLEEKVAEYCHSLTQAEVQTAETLLKHISENDYKSVDRSALASYGLAMVVPLLVAHAPHCNPNSRHYMTGTLWLIEAPIVNEIADFMRRFPDWQCARVTAFEALEERAVQAKEDLPRVIHFFETLYSDRNNRIQSNVKYAIGNVRKTMGRTHHRCYRCDRIGPTFLDPDLNKLLCGRCLWGSVPSRCRHTG